MYNRVCMYSQLLMSGSFGICLLCCFKKEYPGMSPGFCLSLTKARKSFMTHTVRGRGGETNK